MTKISPKKELDAINRSPKIKFKVACEVIESVNFVEYHGFYEVTGNFELDFQAIGRLYLGANFDFSSSFFELFLMAISIKNGQVPY